jgi:hypothetical protein
MYDGRSWVFNSSYFNVYIFKWRRVKHYLFDG